MGIAVAYLRSGLDVDEVLPELKEIVDDHPDWGRAVHNLAVALALAGKFDEARGHAIHALELLPDSEHVIAVAELLDAE